MKNYKLVYFGLLVVSAAVICFEIISTRISSVVFVSNYAFIILSIAILGIGCGGIYSYYKIDINDERKFFSTIALTIFFIAAGLVLFIGAVTLIKLTNPFIYFFLLFLPFFFAGIIYSLLFKAYAAYSFKIYAADLTGAAIGSIASIAVFAIFSAPNTILFLSLVLFATALTFLFRSFNPKIIIGLYSLLSVLMFLLLMNGNKNIFPKVPIGNFPEKDFYHVYSGPDIKSDIIESRWSVYGRTDLVEYNHQDMVKQLFIDGSAGTQMYRFSGDIHNINRLLYNLIIRHSTTIPLLFLQENEKDNMLVIGPGGGKEVLAGLLAGVHNITGIEINPDFVKLVREYRNYNGGIYTDFPNVNIEVKEGRHFIKMTDKKFDLIVIALPSTERLESIDNLAMSENFLLTTEAILDYLKILTPEGRLVFTVHNRWELIRLMVMAMTAFEETGINNQQALNHFVLLSQDYGPSIIIKKSAFSQAGIEHIKNISSAFPDGIPSVTYLPYNWNNVSNTVENRLLINIKKNKISLRQYIDNDPYDISPVYDDSPYFYKVHRGIPTDYLVLLIGVGFISLVVVIVPYARIKGKVKKNQKRIISISLIIFALLGLGFMIIEVTFFQKLILYLGSPTISLSILLSSLLIGMGIGSYFGKKIHANNIKDRIRSVALFIIIAGIISFLVSPVILNKMLAYNQVLRSITAFVMILPFGFLLGIPFPSAIQLLKESQMQKYIPWMYGINGIMSVTGSVSAVIFSMLFGYTPAFFFGLTMYLIVYWIISKLPLSPIMKI